MVKKTHPKNTHWQKYNRWVSAGCTSAGFLMIAYCLCKNNNVYTQVVDNRRIIKGFFWSIMAHYSKDCSLDDDNSNEILGGNSKWYIIAIICYLKNKYTSCNNVFLK